MGCPRSDAASGYADGPRRGARGAEESGVITPDLVYWEQLHSGPGAAETAPALAPELEVLMHPQSIMLPSLTPVQWVRFWPKVDFAGACWLWTGARSDGYGSFYSPDGVIRAHRLVWLALHGSIPDGLHVLHHCDVRACVRPSHLFRGTNNDNIADRMAKGRSCAVFGERNGRAVLTEDAAREIRRLYQDGIGCVTLGRRFGVNRNTIMDIVRREKWSHVN